MFLLSRYRYCPCVCTRLLPALLCQTPAVLHNGSLTASKISTADRATADEILYSLQTFLFFLDNYYIIFVTFFGFSLDSLTHNCSSFLLYTLTHFEPRINYVPTFFIADLIAFVRGGMITSYKGALPIALWLKRNTSLSIDTPTKHIITLLPPNYTQQLKINFRHIIKNNLIHLAMINPIQINSTHLLSIPKHYLPFLDPPFGLNYYVL